MEGAARELEGDKFFHYWISHDFLFLFDERDMHGMLCYAAMANSTFYSLSIFFNLAKGKLLKR